MMRRVMPILLVLFALLAFAPAVAAQPTGLRATPRESFESTGFDAFSSVCDARTCTDTFIFAVHETTSSGETFTFACAEQFTFNIRTGRGTGAFGCADVSASALTVAGDLSSASLAPTAIEVCGNRCETITVSAELEGTGETSTFRGRFTERDENCTFTFTESGERQSATGSLTFDGETMDAQGTIFSSQTTFSSRCR
jgi:hypothetical protein